MSEEAMSNQQAGFPEDSRALVFGYYTKHHEIVLTKIEHAHTATVRSMGECVSIGDGADPAALQDLEKYDGFWKELIALFKNSGMSFEGLGKIDEVLLRLPGMIKTYYKKLVKTDKRLLTLMKELGARKYSNVREALQIMKYSPSDDLLSFSDVDAYRAEGAAYILRRVSALPA